MFEALTLGVFETGLSWSIVFGKREGFREAFHRKLTAELGGTCIQTQGPTLGEALAATARAQHAGIIVVGRHQSRLAAFFLGSVSARLRRLVPQADVREVPTS
jgi:K+-sensing histidine kinase KdpD